MALFGSGRSVGTCSTEVPLPTTPSEVECKAAHRNNWPASTGRRLSPERIRLPEFMPLAFHPLQERHGYGEPVRPLLPGLCSCRRELEKPLRANLFGRRTSSGL